jgi:ribosomal protein S18 acetylase RimI-like enzyme
MDPRNRADVEAVSALHEQFLADSVVSKMGPAFVRNVYYSKLLKDRLYDCYVCRHEGKVIAFITYTDRPGDFMSRGLKRHFFAVAWNVGLTVLTSPRRLKDVRFVLKLMTARGEGGSDEYLKSGAAEALSMAVLPGFQKLIPEGGKSRVAVRLLEEMGADLRERGVKDIAFYVDPKNSAANLLYSAMGCKFEKIVHAGIVRHRFIYSVAPRIGAAT